jgi:hypothetical protein
MRTFWYTPGIWPAYWARRPSWDIRSSIPKKRRCNGLFGTLAVGVLGRESIRIISMSLIDPFSSSLRRSPKSRSALSVGLFSRGSATGVTGRFPVSSWWNESIVFPPSTNCVTSIRAPMK